MPLIFCYTIPETKYRVERRICEVIPIPIKEDWKPIPPEPPELVDFHDWAILGSIDVLARGLSRNQGADILESVANKIAAAARDLGPDASLTLQAAGV